jgi:hypothetical protein
MVERLLIESLSIRQKKMALSFSQFDVSIVNQKLVLTVPELRPGSVVYMKEAPLEPFGDNVFYVAGGSFYGNFILSSQAMLAA